MSNITNTDFLLIKSPGVTEISMSPVRTSEATIGTINVDTLNFVGLAPPPWSTNETAVLTGNWTGPMYNNPGPTARIVLTKTGALVNLHIEFFSRACENQVQGALSFTGTAMPDSFKPYISSGDLLVQSLPVQFNSNWQLGTLSIESTGAIYIEPMTGGVWTSFGMYDTNTVYSTVGN